MAELKHTEDSSVCGVCKNCNDHIREKLVELLREGIVFHYFSTCEEQADYLIANGVTVQEWIPVSERLPEKGEGTVLVCGSRGGIYTAYLERSGKYPKWHKLNSKNHYCEPTHWMPLPEAPKGE